MGMYRSYGAKFCGGRTDIYEAREAAGGEGEAARGGRRPQGSRQDEARPRNNNESRGEGTVIKCWHADRQAGRVGRWAAGRQVGAGAGEERAMSGERGGAIWPFSVLKKHIVV